MQRRQFLKASLGAATRDAAAGWRCDIEKLQEVLL